jgi:hypothetical protein
MQMPEQRTIRVFLSTVSDEFRVYRDQLRSDLTRPNVEVKVQEDFKDLGGVTLENLDAYIKACDAVIHLLGDMTGAAAGTFSTRAILDEYPDLLGKLPPLAEAVEKGIPISYTQWEAWLALYHDKALLIAKADNAAPRGPAYAPTDASCAAQQAHLARLAAVERYPGSVFMSPDNLASQIAYTKILDLLARAQSTSDHFSGNDVAKILGPPVMMALGTLLTWLTARQSAALGSALTALLSILGGISALAISLIYGRYFGILGATKGSPERESYVRLRASLAKGGIAARLYADRLTRFIDAVDRFFGDAGMANRSLFPHAFGLKKPAALWTPRAFDRCLFLALVYPIATIFIIWALSGHAAQAESALGLEANLSGWSRCLIAACAAFQGFMIWSLSRRKRQKSVAWNYAAVAMDTRVAASIDAVIVVGAVAGAAALTVLFGSAGAGALAFGIAVVAAVARAGRVAGAMAVAVAIPVAIALAFGLGGAPQSTVAVAAAIAAASGLGILLLCAIAIKLEALGVFFLLFIPAAIVACLVGVGLLLPLTTWPHIGPLLLFQGLLTLINAPFNWASIGMTRALLRRGLELGGVWPYFLALADAILAALIVALLALVMVITVQGFNGLVANGGSAPFMPLDQLLDGIAENPAAAEYWWIYALLLASMIPSLINLMIGGASLIGGAPGIPSLILRFMPKARAVPAFDRTWIAVVLTLQTFLGAILGAGAGAFLVVVLTVYVMPHAGLSLLEQARTVAALDLPMRVYQFFD